MAAHDSSWDIFRAEIKRWMELRRVTNRELAAALNDDLAQAGLNAPVDEQIVKRWRHSTAPPLRSLKAIARILQMSNDPTGRGDHDPTYLPRTMGILDTAPDRGELIEAAYRLQSLRTQIVDAQATLSAVTADEGVMNIVRAAVHADLGCAVLPVYEGAPGYPMHVCDRIDIRTIDPAGEPDLEQYAQLRDALQDGFAVRSWRTPRFCLDGETPVSQWAVPYIGRPRSRGLHSTHRGLPAIAITSVTTAGWLDDIGDIVAMVLGYGFTTTRELARELVSNPYNHDELRDSIHDNFLHAATPQRRVWAHDTQGLPADIDRDPFLDRSERVGVELVQFFISEDDDLLELAAQRPLGSTEEPSPIQVATSLATLKRARETLRRHALEAGPGRRVFVLAATMHSTPEGRWRQVLEGVLSILRTLEGLGIEPQVDDLHERLMRTEPNVAPQILRWLADHDAPFVSTAFRTTR